MEIKLHKTLHLFLAEWSISKFAIGNQNICRLRCLSKRGMVNYDRGEIHDKHCSEPEQDFLVSAVLNFCTLFLFSFWIERVLQTALRAIKVNELHQIEDVNYKQVSTVFRSVQCSAVQFWIDPQNLKCVCFLNKSRLWCKISFKN